MDKLETIFVWFTAKEKIGNSSKSPPQCDDQDELIKGNKHFLRNG
jgi:hypothetical protein